MANEAGIWFPYHIKDIRSETYNMSRFEKCLYVDLIEILWENDGSVPSEDKWLSANLGMKLREWASVKDRVLRSFEISNGILSHKRISLELNKAKACLDQKRRAGIASAEAKKAAKEAAERSTDAERVLQRALNERCNGEVTENQREANGESTASQPRAGGGGGGGVGPLPLPRETSLGVTLLGEGLDFPNEEVA